MWDMAYLHHFGMFFAGPSNSITTCLFPRVQIVRVGLGVGEEREDGGGGQRGEWGKGGGETGVQGQASDTTSLCSLWACVTFCMPLRLASELSYLYRLELPLVG